MNVEWAVGSGVERLVHTEEVAGSNPALPIFAFFRKPQSVPQSQLDPAIPHTQQVTVLL